MAGKKWKVRSRGHCGCSTLWCTPRLSDDLSETWRGRPFPVSPGLGGHRRQSQSRASFLRLRLYSWHRCPGRKANQGHTSCLHSYHALSAPGNTAILTSPSGIFIITVTGRVHPPSESGRWLITYSSVYFPRLTPHFMIHHQNRSECVTQLFAETSNESLRHFRSVSQFQPLFLQTHPNAAVDPLQDRCSLQGENVIASAAFKYGFRESSPVL